MPAARFLSRQAALPTEHGSWVFLLSPLLIGLLLGGTWGWPQIWLMVAVLAAFLSRQPVTLLVKIRSGRRPRNEQPAALFWLAVYGSLAGLAGLALWWQGYFWLFWLVIPALPVMGWHLWLVSRRSERRQPLVEILGSAALALAAPAGWWLGSGGWDGTGWLLWVLLVAQNAASILYAYLRLAQRVLPSLPEIRGRLRLGWVALTVTTFNLLLGVGLGLAGWIPGWLWLAYLVQWAEAIYGTFRPAINHRPVRIGIRQLVVSILFSLVFIVSWFI